MVSNRYSLHEHPVDLEYGYWFFKEGHGNATWTGHVDRRRIGAHEGRVQAWGVALEHLHQGQPVTVWQVIIDEREGER